MKAIMVMFDTLRRNALPPYGGDHIIAPNFERLAKQTIRFERFYAGSLPCMPARRELHTGRYNFLHRSWGPLEPFDVSMPEILKEKGIYTHLVTDHSHYFEDGGATYHNRYNTWEGFRGQEGDRWKPQLGAVEIPSQVETVKSGESFKQNWVNRSHQRDETQMSAYKTFEAGLDFLNAHSHDDQWFLQIECFDPHEPFFTPEKYRKLYPELEAYKGKHFDWPSYQPVTEDDCAVDHLKWEYAALVTMCDAYLGKVLDVMYENDLWKDTMLIVNTDHGFLLGEHAWWGKNVQPMYNEVSHLPFFIWDPRIGASDDRCNALAQTIDIAPTLIEFFDAEIPSEMQGKPLRKAIESDEVLHSGVLFGVHGAHVNYTDGRYVYMRSPIRADNQPLNEYTLMPTKMRGFFSKSQMESFTLESGFKWTQGIPVLKMPARPYTMPYVFGNLLFDLEADPLQPQAVSDEVLEHQCVNQLAGLMRASEAPKEQFERLGLNFSGETTLETLRSQKSARVDYKSFSWPEKMDLTLKDKKQLFYLRCLMRSLSDEAFLEKFQDAFLTDSTQNDPPETVCAFIERELRQLNLGPMQKMMMATVCSADRIL